MMEYNQSGPGNLLNNVQPGQRVRERLGNFGSGDMGPDLGQNGGPADSVDIPDEPGPAVAGRTPLVGSLRRSNDMPVIRDQLGGMGN